MNKKPVNQSGLIGYGMNKELMKKILKKATTVLRKEQEDLNNIFDEYEIIRNIG